MNRITIEIVYADTQIQYIKEIEIPNNTTVITALSLSGIFQKFPEIDLAKNRIGVFGKLVSEHSILQSGDRIEIYRPLLLDPKEARRLKTKKI